MARPVPGDGNGVPDPDLADLAALVSECSDGVTSGDYALLGKAAAHINAGSRAFSRAIARIHAITAAVTG